MWWQTLGYRLEEAPAQFVQDDAIIAGTNDTFHARTLADNKLENVSPEYTSLPRPTSFIISSKIL